MTLNTIYIRRRSKVILLPANDKPNLPLNYVTSVSKNLESLGYALSDQLMMACRCLSWDELKQFYGDLSSSLREGKGAHQLHSPMYPNFPEQVMEMSEAELYLNAVVHYLTQGQLFPVTEVEERLPLFDSVNLKIIGLGDAADFESLFTQIVSSNTSLSAQDVEDITWFVGAYKHRMLPLLPEKVPQKETAATLAKLLMANIPSPEALVSKFVRTATDVLRLAVALSGGDVSLALKSRFHKFKRPERKLLLSLLENVRGDITEDMLRHKEQWKMLGGQLHPGEFPQRYPRTIAAFNVLRNNIPFEKTNTVVELALEKKDVESVVGRLKHRPGDFARRLDHLLRVDCTHRTQMHVVSEFDNVADKVSTPVLLQVMHHFRRRDEIGNTRVFFPKGNLAKAKGIPNDLPDLASDVCLSVALVCEKALKERFSRLSSLGNVYVDQSLKDYIVPFSQRSASKTLRTIVRGSRISLESGKDTVRFFVWWKNGSQRTDIDLSAVLLDEKFGYVADLSYYNLRNYGGVHSGDIVDAPNGASEFIDVSLSALQAQGIRYIVMSLYNFTMQPYCDLPECFAGWMMRQVAQSGEIFEPKTVVDRIDLSANATVAIPLLIDVVDRQVIWADLSLSGRPSWGNNSITNMNGVEASVRSMVRMSKPSLYDLFLLHAEARGRVVHSAAEADTVFSTENDIQFKLEEVGSAYMA